VIAETCDAELVTRAAKSIFRRASRHCEGELFDDESLVDLLDAAPEGILLVGADGRIVFASTLVQELFGYTREQVRCLPVEALMPARFRASHAGARTDYAAAPHTRSMVSSNRFHGLRSDGTEFPIDVSLAPLLMGGQTLTVAVVREAVEQPATQEERPRHACSHAVEGISWEASAPDRESITYLGRPPETFLGYTQAAWLAPGFWLSVVHADDRAIALTFAQTAQDHDTFELEYRLIDADGEPHEVRDVVSVRRRADGEIDGLSGTIVDLTETRRVGQQLSQARKMEAVGQLASAISHDFNDLLTVVSGHARRLLAREDLAGGREGLQQIVTAADRAAELTKQLLAFARRAPGELAPLDVNATVHALEPMLRRLVEADIVLRFGLDEQLERVMMDRTELEQIVMNLTINASDALRDGGTLTVKAQAVAREAYPGVHAVGTRDLVCLTVSDTGEGMTPEVRERVFEPFFTTKGAKGTGMGLATVYSIVVLAGGVIEIDTEPGAGSAFRIVLPGVAAIEPPEPPGRAPMAAALVGAGEQADRPTVLVVEDEPSLRRLVGLMLEEHGYTVVLAANGVEALEMAESHDGSLELLLTDVVMPGMTGPELAKRIRGVRPGLKILYMSGYNDSRLASQQVEHGDVSVLIKPFTPNELLDSVGAASGVAAQQDRPASRPARELIAVPPIPERSPAPLRPSYVFMAPTAGGPPSPVAQRAIMPAPSQD
jgi:PAS domain S-box-containing protein